MAGDLAGHRGRPASRTPWCSLLFTPATLACTRLTRRCRTGSRSPPRWRSGCASFRRFTARHRHRVPRVDGWVTDGRRERNITTDEVAASGGRSLPLTVYDAATGLRRDTRPRPCPMPNHVAPCPSVSAAFENEGIATERRHFRAMSTVGRPQLGACCQARLRPAQVDAPIIDARGPTLSGCRRTPTKGQDLPGPTR